MTSVFNEVVPAKSSWSGIIKEGQTLTITDLEGQQAVDFLCYDADNTNDRFSSTNTIKIQGNVYIGKNSILYAESGRPLLIVEEDTFGKHDTIYGCCSDSNNKLRYGVETNESCFKNFEVELLKHDMGIDAIVPNVNWFMNVPILEDGSASVAITTLRPQSYVKLRAECNVLAVLSNCPQIHNSCNGYNPTPILVSVEQKN